MVGADYRPELGEVGPLNDDVYVARYTGQVEAEVRAWVLETLKKFTEG